LAFPGEFFCSLRRPFIVSSKPFPIAFGLAAYTNATALYIEIS